MYNIKVQSNRKIKKNKTVLGTQYENLATTLLFEFPETLEKDGIEYNVEELNKYIVFDNFNNENNQDVIEDNKYSLKFPVTSLDKIIYHIELKEKSYDPDAQNVLVWSTATDEISLNNIIPGDSKINPEKVDILNTLITQVENINIDGEKTEDTSIIKIRKKDGTEKELIIVDGKDALINGKNVIDIVAGDNIEIIQNENELTIKAKGYDDSDIKQQVENLDFEIDGLIENVNNIALDVSKIDSNVQSISSDVETNKQEILELEENQNYLEENKADRSELTGFIKNTVNDLVNYYKKSETYTQAEVNQLIGAIKTVNMKVLPERPLIGETNIIYLIPSSKSETENIYDEYIYVNDTWEKIGSTKCDLSNYYNKEEINQILFDYITSNDLEEILGDYALKAEIPEIKLDNKTINKNNNNEFQSVGSILKSGGYQNYWKGTKNEFNAISEKDSNTLYEVLDDEETALFEVDGNTIEFSNDNILQIPSKNDLMFQSVTYGNHESGYRKWRNGYIEQWGVATSNANGDAEFVMHQSHIDTNFSVFIEPREQGNFFHYAIPSGVQKFRTRIQSRDSVSMAVKFQWFSNGYWR